MSYSVAVRALCEFAARSGDLDRRFTPAPSALDGVAGHNLVQRNRGVGYEAEIRLSGTFGDLKVQGRADGFDSLKNQIDEIKTHRGPFEQLRPHHRALHWAQAKIYGHLLCESGRLVQVQVALVYFNIDTQVETLLTERHSAAELQNFFESVCSRFLSWARSEAVHRQERDAALAALPFPMNRFREGQRELAVAVYRSAQSPDGGHCLMAQAPTGIGKTLGTIFPMLKASATEGLDKVFFLTAKGTGHSLALQALSIINRQLAHISPQAPRRAFQLRVLEIRAREKACEHPDKACHGDSCPLALGFYDRLPQAREAAADSPQPWDASTVRSVALANQVCPYYLAQELVRWSDVVVADYHYYYDTSAMLYALTQAQQWKVGLLVDEAHNLVERARRMYTAELSQISLANARKCCAGPVRKSLNTLNRTWSALNKEQVSAYSAYREVPQDLRRALQRALAALSDAFAQAAWLPGDPLLAFYWEALAFMFLDEQMGPHAIFDVSLGVTASGRTREMRSERTSSSLCIRNVVPAPHLSPRHAAAHTTVLFSGTLSPPRFYQDMLGLPGEAAWLNVEGPFRSDQLSVQVADHISTRYRDREQSLLPIVDVVAQQYHAQPGNYLCFLSSFEYLDRVVECLRKVHPNLPIWLQTRGMSTESREAFLGRFAEGGQGVGFAVLGGAFSEGVDLPGGRLIGAFVATLGLPQVNAINEKMRSVLDQQFGAANGYDYTYLYPGLRKVVQAAGRVIRSEEDRGFVILIDDRYGRAEVKALLPSWWRTGD